MAQLDDFSVLTLIAASVENIGKCFPSSNFHCEVQCDKDISLSGKCFTPLWYIFFLVFENVVRYSGDLSDQTVIAVNVKDSTLTFTITNPLGESQSEDSVRDRLEEIRQYSPEMIRQEGGSGFPKLRNLIRNDLGLDGDRVAFDVDGRTFITRIALDEERLRP